MRRFLDDLAFADPWLRRAGFEDIAAAHRNFIAIADRGIPLDLLRSFRDDLGKCLIGIADADRAFNNFERMLGKVRSPLSLITFLLRKQNSIRVLMQVFSSSQYFSELAIANPEYFDFLWESGFESLEPAALRDEMLYEIRSVEGDEGRVLAILRRHRQMEVLRIGYRDICQGEPLDRIVQSISDLADCMVEVALTVALESRRKKSGIPRRSDGKPAALAVFALGKLGGKELNYSSDIDLMFVYDEDGATDGAKRVANQQFFAGVVQDVIRLLTANTARGQVYRVDLRLRPQGDRAPLCLSLAQTLAYYDQHGRTWERQAMVKLRPIAGDIHLGEKFVEAMQPFIYRRFLNFVEIKEIKAIKRRIESKTAAAGGETTDLKTGHGGIRDIEFVIQFLQLLHGGAKPEVRQANTLRAIRRLTALGSITRDEQTALETAYRFLRKAEHRLQFMFDLQTHRIPEEPAALDRLASRLGYMRSGERRPGEQFLIDLRAIADRNRAMLNRLMYELFQDADGADESHGEPESDLMLDPSPEPERIRQVLEPYGFKDIDAAFRNLQKLAIENVPFLSSIRCRHFLAGVAARLLIAVGEAPDPDWALLNLEKVTASLGAKGVVWESCSVNPSLLRLFVQVCSWSQFLSDILVKNPGMIDELLDTLTMKRQPALAEQKADLARRLRGARDIDPILHSYQNTRLLGIGVQDILGKIDLKQTCRLLSELAETIIGEIIEHHWQQLATDHGVPKIEGEDRDAGFAVLGLGKFGGNELGYHSDLDLVLVYEGDGKTRGEGCRKGAIGNLEFHTELAQRLLKTTSRMGPLGRLYQVDFRLRPTGRSGSLVLPLDRFREYYLGDKAALWERLALTRARVVYERNESGFAVRRAVAEAIAGGRWRQGDVDEVLDMRKRLETSRPQKDIKRGAGGLVDVEFALQALQLRIGASEALRFQSNVWESLEAVEKAGIWSKDRVRVLRDGYSFLRHVESRIRIVYSMARDELPDNQRDLSTLAVRLGYEGPNGGKRLLEDIDRHAGKVRDEFDAIMNEARSTGR